MRGFKGLGRLVVLLVLAVVLIFGPVVRVEAADGEQVAGEISGWVEAVGYGAALLGILLITVIAIGSFQEIREWVKARLIKADKSNVWNTVGGRAINDALRQIQPQLDDASDPLIARLEATKFLNQLRAWGIIKGDDFSRLTAALIADGIKLTNGVPDVEFALLSFDSTQAKG